MPVIVPTRPKGVVVPAIQPVWSTVLSSSNGGNQNLSLRALARNPLQSASKTQVRVSCRVGDAGVLDVLNVGFGKWSGSNFDTTATPIEMLYSAGHGFTGAAASSTVVSDWMNLSGLTWTQGDGLIAIFDTGPANGNWSAPLGTDGTYSGGNTYNSASPGAAWNVAKHNFLLCGIETR